MRAGKSAGSSNGNNDVTIEGSTFRNGLYTAIQGYVNRLTVRDSIIDNVKSGAYRQYYEQQYGNR